MLLLFTLGCGLSDYEEKLEDQQQLLVLGEQVKELLGSPLSTSDLQREKGVPVTVFLRPPKGVSSTPKEERFQEVFSEYRGEKTIIFLASAVEKKKLVSEMLTVFPRTTTQEELKKTYKEVIIAPPPGGKRELKLYRYQFDYTDEKDNTFTHYMYVTPNEELIIIFKQFAQAGKDVDAAREMSIRTLGVDATANSRRSFYSRF